MPHKFHWCSLEVMQKLHSKFLAQRSFLILQNVALALRVAPQKFSEGSCQNVEISNLKTTTSTTLENTNSKLCKNLHFATANKHFRKIPSENDNVFRPIWGFQTDSFTITKDAFARKIRKTARAVPVRRDVYVCCAVFWNDMYTGHWQCWCHWPETPG